MPKTEVAIQEELKLEAKVERQLRQKLDHWNTLREQKKLIEYSMTKVANEINGIREETNRTTLDYNGYKITRINGVHKKFNPKKFVELGGDLSVYNDALESSSSKPYTKITPPTEKGLDDEN